MYLFIYLTLRLFCLLQEQIAAGFLFTLLEPYIQNKIMPLNTLPIE